MRCASGESVAPGESLQAGANRCRQSMRSKAVAGGEVALVEFVAASSRDKGALAGSQKGDAAQEPKRGRSSFRIADV